MVECLLAKEDVASSSLVVPAIKKEGLIPSFLMAEWIVARVAFCEFGGFPYVLSEAKFG